MTNVTVSKIYFFVSSLKEHLRIIQLYKKFYRNWFKLVIKTINVFSDPCVMVTTKAGERFKIRARTFDCSILTDIYINHSYNIPGFEIQKDDVVIDVGAHIGSFSLYAAKNACNGTVFAYEPELQNYYLLKQNIEFHKLFNIKMFSLWVYKRGEFNLHISRILQAIAQLRYSMKRGNRS